MNAKLGVHMEFVDKLGSKPAAFDADDVTRNSISWYLMTNSQPRIVASNLMPLSAMSSLTDRFAAVDFSDARAVRVVMPLEQI